MRRPLLLLVLAAGFGAGSVAQDEPPRWSFVPDVDKEVRFRQPDHQVLRGRLNNTGAFVPDRYNPVVLPSPVQHWMVAANDPNDNPKQPPHLQSEEVYEYRSGALIRGRLRYPGAFVPIPGDRVLWIDDYSPGAMIPRIYNLPGSFARVAPGQERKLFPGTPGNLPLGEWSREGLIPERKTHTFRPDPDRVIGLFRNTTVYAGWLMPGGDFVPLPDIRPVPYLNQPTAIVKRADGTEATIPVVNHPATPEEQVYEIRGWVLLSGRLSRNGQFTPWENMPTVN